MLFPLSRTTTLDTGAAIAEAGQNTNDSWYSLINRSGQSGAVISSGSCCICGRPPQDRCRYQPISTDNQCSHVTNRLGSSQMLLLRNILIRTTHLRNCARATILGKQWEICTDIKILCIHVSGLVLNKYINLPFCYCS